MKYLEQLVETFNNEVLKLELDKREIGIQDEAEYTLSVIQLKEEIEEFIEAHENRSVIGCVDAMIDLVYFAYGVMLKHGLSAEQINQCFSHVHDANMEKKLGVKATRVVDGAPADAIKPEGWVAPEVRIADCLGIV